MKKKNINAIMEYEIYYIDLKPMMLKRGMSNNSLCKATGMAYSTLQKYWKSEVKRVDLDVISRICAALDCKISDIFIKK